jgi:insulysin
MSRKLSVDVADLLPKNDNEFDRYKDQIMRALSAFDVKQPYAHASYYSLLCLQPRRFQYSNKALRDATRKTTLPDLIKYVDTLWLSGKGEALIQGNFNEKEALDLVKTIGDALPFRPIPVEDYPPRLEALPLPTSNALTLPLRLVITEPNPSNENSVSYVTLQCLGESEKDHVLLELINSILAEPFYNDLRTKQQFGYIVSSGIRGIRNTRTLSFIVQSSVAPSDSLTVAILKFLDTVEAKLLKPLLVADLEVYVKSLIDKKTEPDKELAVEVTRNWSEIASGDLKFDRLQQQAAALLNVEKSDLLEFWQEIYGGNGRRVLITEMMPRQGAASSGIPPMSTGFDVNKFSPEEGPVLGIDDIEKFRRDREKLVYDQRIEFPDYTKSTFEMADVDERILASV